MEKFLKISAVNFKHNLLPHLTVSLILCLAAPLFIGTKNLDAYQVAKVMEGYVALIGIVLLIPVFIPDMNKDIRDLTASKQTPMYFLHVIRILWALLFLLILGKCFIRSWLTLCSWEVWECLFLPFLIRRSLPI